MNIVCFGDSITEAAEVPRAARWTTRVQDALDQWRPARYRVYNLGLGGNTSAQGFDRFDIDVLPLLPGVLLVQFGFNDANVRDWSMVPRVAIPEYEKNLREFHRVATAAGADCVFIVNHTIARSRGRQGNGRSYEENFAPYNEALRALAQSLDAPAIDLPARMRERRIDLATFLAPDGLHLTAAGNELYARMVLEDLKPWLAAASGPATK